MAFIERRNALTTQSTIATRKSMKVLFVHNSALRSLAAMMLEPSNGTSAKIGTIQRRLAWSLRKDDTH